MFIVGKLTHEAHTTHVAGCTHANHTADKPLSAAAARGSCTLTLYVTHVVHKQNFTHRNL